MQPPVDGGARSNTKALRFQLNSCSVTSGLVQKSAQVPAEWASQSGLLIGKSGSYISFDGSLVKVKGNFEVEDGDLVVGGNVTVDGDVTADNVDVTGDVTAGLISLRNHKHLSAAPGAPTGPAIP
jgi:hypothetical protein